MGILTWVIVGLIAGALAKSIMPGTQGSSWLATIVLGIIGGLVGGWLGSVLGLGTVNGFNLGSLLLATVGSFIVLWIYLKFIAR